MVACGGQISETAVISIKCLRNIHTEPMPNDEFSSTTNKRYATSRAGVNPYLLDTEVVQKV